MIGLDRLHAIHRNDSMNARGSHRGPPRPHRRRRDRLQSPGRRDEPSKLRDLPFYLETPNPDLAGYAEEIAATQGA